MLRTLLSIVTPLYIFVVSVTALPGIFENYDTPTLSPEERPPAARNATSDKGLLPVQICGIVGAYLIVLILIFGLLLTVGRRARRAAQTSQGTLEMEMKRPKPINTTIEMPLSPTSTTKSWKSPFSPKRIRESFRRSEASGKSAPGTSVHTSVGSFDGSVLESNRHDRQAEMERLYAAVMEHDARKSEAISAKEGKSAGTVQTVEISDAVSRPETVGSNRSARRPPNIITANSSLKSPSGSQLPLSPASAVSGKGSFRAIYPPGFTSESPATHNNFTSAVDRHAPPLPSPTSPTRFEVPTSPHSTIIYQSEAELHNGSSNDLANNVAMTKPKRGLRNLRISAPGRKDVQKDDNEARTPLTARLNNNSDNMQPYDDANQKSGSNTPATVDSDYGQESMDKPAPLPWPAPQRGLGHPSNADNTFSSTTNLPAKSAASSTSTLPLRTIEDNNKTMNGLRSPVMKTTFVDARSRNPLDALRSPGTAGLPTPYSPYMPRTPVTPVTPHLVTKRELKAQRKSKGQVIATQDDVVKDEKDIWGSAY